MTIWFKEQCDKCGAGHSTNSTKRDRPCSTCGDGIMRLVPEPTISERIIKEMELLTDKERLEIIEHFCTICGSNTIYCNCCKD
jgi:hypothetical protein